MESYSANPKDPEFFDNPYPYYDRMRACGPAFRWTEYDMICFPHYREVSELLREKRCGRGFDHVMTRADVGLPEVPEHLKPFYEFESHSMLELEPPEHTRLRGLVNRAFVSREVNALQQSIVELSDQLIAAFPSDEPFDLLKAYAEKIPVIVIARLLGVPETMADQLLSWSHAMVAMYEFDRTRQTEDEAVRATQEFSSYIGNLVDQRRTETGDDLISKLIRAEEQGDRLTTKELVTTVILLLNAGHEATVHAIGNSAKHLLTADSDTRAAFMDAEEKFFGVDELLRFDAPLHLFTRYVLSDFEISGVALQKGQTIGLLLGAANHDPSRYEIPNRLDFKRGGTGHVAFGAGIHFCVGAPLARLEMQIALRRLLIKTPKLTLVQQPKFADRYHFHGLEKLMVRR